MTGNIDPDHTAFLVSDVARRFRAIFEDAILEDNIGVTTAEARVLTLMARGGPMRQTVLADLLCVTPMSVSVFLDGLERSGLVRRDPDPCDRRAKIVSLTAASAPVLSRIAGIGARVQAAALEGIEPEDQAIFAAVAKRIRRNLETRRGMGSDRTGCGDSDARDPRAEADARDPRAEADARDPRATERS